jgi:calpain-15
MDGSIVGVKSLDYGELWPSLLEKTWAKMHGGYRHCGSYYGRVFRWFENMPRWEFNHDGDRNKPYKVEDFWNRLKEGTKLNSAMACARFGETHKGIVGDHAQALLCVYDLTHKGKQLKLVKLRNTWASFEWTGDFSDKSNKWTPELKKAVGWRDSDDGVYCMPFKDFV